MAGTATSAYTSVATATTPASGPTPTWTDADIGAVAIAGSSTVSGTSTTVRGSGNDIWEAADAFHFVHRSLTGDGSIEAQISSLTNTNAWAKAGVMMRESLAPNARNVFACLTPSNGIYAQVRSTTGGATTSQAGVWGASAPRWIRLVRTAGRVVAYDSTDGVTWNQFAAYDVAFGATVYVGMAVTSHDNTQLNSAVFANPAVR